VIAIAQLRRLRWQGSVSRWALWQMPGPARAFVLAADAVFVVALVAGFSIIAIHPSDVRLFLVLTACGIVSVEGSLRLGWRRPRSGTISNDLLAAWTLPAVLLLPAPYAALIVVPLHVYFAFRVMRRRPVKAVFNVASNGLAGFVAAALHGAALGHFGVWDVDGIVGSPAALALSVVCVAVYYLLQSALIATVIAMTQPQARLRNALPNRELLGVMAAESSTGILVAVTCAASPYTALLAIAPVLALQRALLVAEFREAARTDAKTGLANSGYWREVAEREIARARGGRDPLAVLLVDIDHFKDVNDRFGHLTGDDILRAVASALTEGLRPRDFVGRFGGEEFVVLLTGSDLEQARQAAERIRAHVADVKVEATGRAQSVGVTISIGVAAFRESGHSVHELLDAADTALYAAKRAGRNCVRVAEGARQQVLDLTVETPRVLDLRSQRAQVD
jgi:diguanylate cyclase (GGDEF)-like protein